MHFSRPNQIAEAGEMTEIKDAHDMAKRNRKTGYAIEQSDFPLPHLSRSINSWTDEIENGRGFLIVRGFPVEIPDEASLYDTYWGLGRYLGDAIIKIMKAGGLTRSRAEVIVITR